MKLTGNHGVDHCGATGMGFAMAEAFLKAGNEVIICGREGKQGPGSPQEASRVSRQDLRCGEGNRLHSAGQWTGASSRI